MMLIFKFIYQFFEIILGNSFISNNFTPYGFFERNSTNHYPKETTKY